MGNAGADYFPIPRIPIHFKQLQYRAFSGTPLDYHNEQKNTISNLYGRHLMEKKNVLDKRAVKLERMMMPGYIPFLEGRPKRETVIGNEDIINLHIALETCKSLEEFLAMV